MKDIYAIAFFEYARDEDAPAHYDDSHYGTPDIGAAVFGQEREQRKSLQDGETEYRYPKRQETIDTIGSVCKLSPSLRVVNSEKGTEREVPMGMGIFGFVWEPGDLAQHSPERVAQDLAANLRMVFKGEEEREYPARVVLRVFEGSKEKFESILLEGSKRIAGGKHPEAPEEEIVEVTFAKGFSSQFAN